MKYYGEDFAKDMKQDKMFEKGGEMAMPCGEAMNSCCEPMMAGTCCQPIYECPQERVCHRYICYEVPHIMPCNTRIINHHVYRHTYRPEFTSCEENVVSNVYDRGCCM